MLSSGAVRSLRAVVSPVSPVFVAFVAFGFSLAAAEAGFALDAAPPAEQAPSGGPFGPGYDPTRPAPVEPETKGKGIVSATVVAAGPADVEQLRMTGAPDAPPYFGVVLDLRVEAGSTTPLLSAASIAAQPESGPARPVVAACLPTMDDPAAVYHLDGIRIGAWNIAIDGRTWNCSGRTGRLAIRIGTGGFRVTIKPGADWNGPLLLLFDPQPDPPRRIVLPGVTVELPLPPKEGVENSDKAGGKAN
jgi:hypothetical protein